MKVVTQGKRRGGDPASAAICAELIGSDEFTAAGLTISGRAPVLALCRQLICETPASNGRCHIVPFDLLVPPGANDAITGKAPKCAQCGKGRRQPDRRRAVMMFRETRSLAPDRKDARRQWGLRSGSMGS